MADSGDQESYTLSSCVRGHHVYKDIWSPFVGQEIDVKIEPMNPRDAYAVATLIDYIVYVVVGHVPIDFSKISWYFIHHGGQIKCTITGHCRLSDEASKGLEVPCSYTFLGKPTAIICRQV